MSKHETFTSLEELKKRINESISSDTLLLIVDTNVYNLYRKEFNFLQWEGKKVHLWKCLEGEGTKNFEELNNCIEFFLTKGIHRNCHVVAFGGGACSDFAGLVASLLLRGLKWSVVPTTLLSMIDASIGGKVGINSASGKNLVGGFHEPDTIYFYHDFINTLDRENFASGKGELIKYYFLDDQISRLVTKKAPMSEIIDACANYKSEVVRKDFKEGGLRKILNFGHTFGHAFEKIFSLPHGISVIWGAILILILEDRKDLLACLRQSLLDLGVELGESPWHNKSFPVLEVMEFISKDKKIVSEGNIDIVVIEEIGEPEVKTIKIDEIRSGLEERMDEIKRFVL